MAASVSFEDLMRYLESQRNQIMEARCKSIKQFLNSGRGKQQDEAARLRYKHYLELCKMEKTLSPDRLRSLQDFEESLCEDDFSKFVRIVQQRKEEFKQMQKPKLRDIFTTRSVNCFPEFKFCQNHVLRQTDNFSVEQRKIYDDLEQLICCPDPNVTVRGQYDRFMDVLFRRRQELIAARKKYLTAIFASPDGKKDSELTFCYYFLMNLYENLPESLQKEIKTWQDKLCTNVGAAVLPTVQERHERFQMILNRRQDEFIALRKPGLLEQLFSTRQSKTDTELIFCNHFTQHTYTKLSAQQQQELLKWKKVLCKPENVVDVSESLVRFEEVVQRHEQDLVRRKATSGRSLFTMHSAKHDSDLKCSQFFLNQTFPKLKRDLQRRAAAAVRRVLWSQDALPPKESFKPKLHNAETVLGDALPRPRQPKSLRQFYGNSQDAETCIMTFFHRVHEVDKFLGEMQFQHCDYCKIGWFGTKRQKAEMPGGFECAAFKLNVLQAPEASWLDPARPICKACLDEAKQRAKQQDDPMEPFRLTAANHMDPGEALPETDALTFFEEELLSPIQHIIRIFTLHATGQCELRGHVGNLFQNGPQYVREIPAAIGDMKMLLVRRCPKDPSRKQRVPFLVSRRRLEAALDRICKPLAEGGSAAVQPGALTTEGYVSFVRRDNLDQFDDSEEGAEPEGLQVTVVEQEVWEFLEYDMFVMWMSNRLQLQLAAVVRGMHEPEEWESEAERAAGTWKSLRSGMGPDLLTGGPNQIRFGPLAGYLHLKSAQLQEKTRVEVENILHDEITTVQELASWEEPLVEGGCFAPEDMANAKTEDELHDECWDALHEACSSGGQIGSLGRFGADRISGLPILDPPTVLSRKQLIREDQPYYIVAGFVKLFPLGLADYWAHAPERQQNFCEHFFLGMDAAFAAAQGRAFPSAPALLLLRAQHSAVQQSLARKAVFREETDWKQRQHVVYCGGAAENG